MSFMDSPFDYDGGIVYICTACYGPHWTTKEEKIKHLNPSKSID